jgi:hypothetical protein
MNKPHTIGSGTNAMIGSDKIIFCINQSSTMDVEYNYIVVTYSEPFTIDETQETLNQDYEK